MADLPDWGMEIVKSIEIDSNITNLSLDVEANITNLTLDVEANITNASIETNSNITNASIETNANITNASIATTANITGCTVTFDTNITNASINVEANITNANIEVNAELVKSINITVHTSPNWLNLSQTEIIKQVSLPEGNNAIGTVGILPSCDIFLLSYNSDSASINSIQEYKDNLYCGSTNLGKIYVYDGSIWGLEVTHGVNCWNMIVFDGYLWHTNASDTKIWYFDGTNWVSDDAPAGETSLQALCEYEGSLYVGSGNTGKVFIYDITDGFTEVYDSAATGISAMCVWNDKLFFGGSNDSTLYCYDGVDWFKKKIFSAGNITSIEVYNNKLFMGLDNGEVWEFDGIKWNKIIDIGANVIYKLKSWNNYLYIGTPNIGTVWKYNGTMWNKTYFDDADYITAMGIYRSNLFLGTATSGKIYEGKTIEALNIQQRYLRTVTGEKGDMLNQFHGNVAADWTTDTSGTKTMDTWRDFYITDLFIWSDTDPTAELGTNRITIQLLLENVTTSKDMATFTLEMPNSCSVHLKTPIIIKRNNQWRTQIKLGGATALDLNVRFNGFYDDY